MLRHHCDIPFKKFKGLFNYLVTYSLQNKQLAFKITIKNKKYFQAQRCTQREASVRHSMLHIPLKTLCVEWWNSSFLRVEIEVKTVVLQSDACPLLHKEKQVCKFSSNSHDKKVQNCNKTQQGRQREPSVKKHHSLLSAKI